MNRFSKIISKIINASTDEEYLKAVEENDIDKAQKMVDNEADRKGYIIKAYHGTKSFKGNKFDRNESAQGIFWFSEDKGTIERGESGAVGFSNIIHVRLKVEKTAGWEEYEKFALMQIEGNGFDSIKLDDDWIIFDERRIKLADSITKDNSGKVIPLSKRFDSSKTDIRY